MSGYFRSLWLALWLASACAAAAVRPSDCRPRDADSTCAVAVPAATEPVPPFHQDGTLYDGPLGGVPAIGYSYWGWDFIADQTGTPSPVRPDEFINRSSVPVTITLSFDVPARASCGHDCLPGVEFEIGPGWFKVDPSYIRVEGHVSLTATVKPSEGYAWVIALWQASNPRLTVTVPKNAVTSLAAVGIPADPAVSDEIARVIRTCECSDATIATCSDGSRFSNGLLGGWNQEGGGYTRAGLFSTCADIR